MSVHTGGYPGQVPVLDGGRGGGIPARSQMGVVVSQPGPGWGGTTILPDGGYPIWPMGGIPFFLMGVP